VAGLVVNYRSFPSTSSPEVSVQSGMRKRVYIILDLWGLANPNGGLGQNEVRSTLAYSLCLTSRANVKTKEGKLC
jgi:hypothetical protein